MFNDLAVLVAAQGEIIDRIEVNVGNTHSYTESAVRDLQKSNSYGHANRKKMCCIVCACELPRYIMIVVSDA